MAVDTAADFVALLRNSRLLEPHQLNELTGSLQARFPQPRALAAELLRRGWLTAFQINQLFQGHGDDLLLGSYVLLERLGAGGMGQVFKARNWKLDKIVALKLIRAERLHDADALRRFQREVRAAAQLNHPNVVHAFDCDEAGGKHFLVLEYVEGHDLGRWVKNHGPLPAAQACEYVRQAALGLQHAFERGLVHRDVKPQNLLLIPGNETTPPAVKILDMGLARLNAGNDEAESSSTMTEEGVVMGTLDYLAPEQAMDAHSADTRADLYSLGCTLYVLLTGQVPFPGGSAAEKLLKHQSRQATPIEQLRPDVPPVVAAVVRKLMAKRPEERFQTPAELAAFLGGIDLQQPATWQIPAPPPQLSEAYVDTSAGWSSLVAPDEKGEIVSPSDSRHSAPPRRKLLLLAVAAGIPVLGLAIGLPFLLRSTPGPATAIATTASEAETQREKPPPTFEDWLRQTGELSGEEQVKAVTAKLKLRNKEFDGVVKSTIEDNVVVRLVFATDKVTDIHSLRALTGLRHLDCRGSVPSMGRLADLSPLKGMKLTVLFCSDNPITDLTPLRDVPLQHLVMVRTHVRDLSPLRGMPLQILFCTGAPIEDLSPLGSTPLQRLHFNWHRWRDLDLLRSFKHLRGINKQPAADFWKQVDAETAKFEAWRQSVAALPPNEQIKAVVAELKKRNPNYGGRIFNSAIEKDRVVRLELYSNGVMDVSPLRALAHLRELSCSGNGVRNGILSDLWPLKGLPLTSLTCAHCRVASLTPLQGMPLKLLNCSATQVTDLSPLQGMPLETLDVRQTRVSDLSPLKELPLRTLGCDAATAEALAVLRSIKTLQTINGKPAAEFWKEVPLAPSKTE